MDLIPTVPRRAMVLVVLCGALFSIRVAEAQLRFPYQLTGAAGRPPSVDPGPIDFSPDSRHLAMPGGGNRIVLWDLREAARTAVLDHSSGQNSGIALDTICITGEGRRLAAVYSGRIAGEARKSEIIFYDVKRPAERASVPLGAGPPRAMAFSPDGANLALVTDRGKGRGITCDVKVWDVATAEPLRSLDSAPDGSDVAYSPDGKWLATVHGITDDKGQIILWDATTFERRHVLRAGGGWLSLAFSADSKLIAAGVNHQKRRKLVDFVVRTWDVTSGKEAGMAQIDVGGESISAVVLPLFSPDSQSLVVTCIGGVATTQYELLNVTSGEQRLLFRGEWRRSHPFHRWADFSPDGRLLATTGTDARPEVTLWDTKHWNIVRTLDMSATGEWGSRGSSIECVRFSPDSKWLAALRTDFVSRNNVHQQEVMLWNLAETLDAPSDTVAPKLNR